MIRESVSRKQERSSRLNVLVLTLGTSGLLAFAGTGCLPPLCEDGGIDCVVGTINQDPTADAGADQDIVDVDTRVELSGLGSTDPDGDPLTYKWERRFGPSVTLDGVNSALASFTPLEEGVYEFVLTVTDDRGGSDNDTVLISVGDDPLRCPRADAGTDRTVDEASAVTLRGGNSADPSGNPLSYEWFQLSGEQVSINGVFGVEPDFIAPQVNGVDIELEFELTVTNDQGCPVTDTVVITVRDLNPCSEVVCADGLFCTGTESCDEGTCVSSGDPCPVDMHCNEATDACDECLVDIDCDDGDACTTDVCSESGTCDRVDIAGCCNSDEDCEVDKLCNQVANQCVFCLTDFDCDDDGIYCNGVATCAPESGECVSSGSPCTADEICDELDGCVANALAGRIAYTVVGAGGPELWILDMSTGLSDHVSALTDVRSPVFSRDGARLAFGSGDGTGGKINTAKPNGMGLLEVASSPFGGEPSFSGDASEIVFHASEGGWRLITVKSDGSNRQPLPNPGVHGSWSPVEDKIAYSNWATIPSPYQSDIFVYDRTTGETSQITAHAANHGFVRAQWSPDGLRLAVSEVDHGTGKQDLWVMNADGSDPVNVTNDWPTSSEGYPSWSPDGAYIVFSSDRTGDTDVWSMRPDGSGRVNLTNTSDTNEGAPWIGPAECDLIFGDRQLVLERWDETSSVGSPTVIREAGGYRMWLRSEYQVGRSGIFTTTSPDGLTWADVQTSLLPGPTSWDSFHLYEGTVIKEGALYKMWYTGYGGSNNRIGYATSDDGVNWTKYDGNPVVQLGAWDSRVARIGSVIFDAYEGLYKMWYTGGAGWFHPLQVGYATSVDGIVWTKHPSPVFTSGSSAEWINHHVNVTKHDGIYRMFFSSSTFDLRQATSLDGIEWTAKDCDPTLEPTPADWDSNYVGEATCVWDGPVCRLWYRGNDSSLSGIGFLESLP